MAFSIPNRFRSFDQTRPKVEKNCSMDAEDAGQDSKFEKKSQNPLGSLVDFSVFFSMIFHHFEDENPLMTFSCNIVFGKN